MQLRLAFAVAAFSGNRKFWSLMRCSLWAMRSFRKSASAKWKTSAKSGRDDFYLSVTTWPLSRTCAGSAYFFKRAHWLQKATVPRSLTSTWSLHSRAANLKKRLVSGTLGFNSEADARKIIRKVELYCDGGALRFCTYGACELEIKVLFCFAQTAGLPRARCVVFRDSEGTAVLGVNNNHYVGKRREKNPSRKALFFVKD